MRSLKIVLGAGLIALGCAAPVEEAEETVSAQTQEIGTAAGKRPLLVVMLKKKGTTMAFTKQQFRERIFGTSSTAPDGIVKLSGSPPGTVSDYFSYQSGGAFTFVEAGMFSYTDNLGEVDELADRGRNGLRLAVESGFDFSRYDKNRDGKVTTDELSIIVFDTYSESAATVLGAGCVKHNGVRVCSDMALIGHRSPQNLIAHELAHQVGAFDIYGPWAQSACNSNAATLMSCSGGPDGTWVYMDPWHRTMLGWNTGGSTLNVPASGSGSVTLRAAGTYGTQRLRMQRQDPNGGGITEWVEFEPRARNSVYENMLPVEGVLAWYEDTNDGRPFDIPSLRFPEATDRTIFTLSGRNCKLNPMHNTRGVVRALTGKYRILWRDGTDSGVVVTITDKGGGAYKLSWTTGVESITSSDCAVWYQG